MQGQTAPRCSSLAPTFMGWFSKSHPSQQKPAISFAIEWAAEVPAGDFEATDAALFITDVEGINDQVVRTILHACGAASGRETTRIVWVTPGLQESAARCVAESGGVTVRARPLPGQPLRALMEDVALFAGGRFLAGELGFGLPRLDLPSAVAASRIVAPGIPWNEIHLADLGRVTRIKGNASLVQLQAEKTPAANVVHRVQQLESQLPQAADEVERAGLEARLRRFGAEPANRGLPPAAADALPPRADVLLPGGLASPYFITSPQTLTCELDHAWVLVIDAAVTEFTTLLPSLALAVQHQKPLVVLAPEIKGSALAGLVVNKLRGVLRCAAIGLATAESPSKAIQLRQVADRTGAWLATPDDLHRLARPDERMFGRVARVEADRHRCRFTLRS